MSENKVASLDALRGILSITVCIAHAWQTFLAPQDNDSLTPLHYLFGVSARIAVLAFFALSGYVIAMSVESNIKRHRQFDVYDFALKRTFRVLPPLLFVFILTFGLGIALSLLGFATVNGDAYARRPHFESHLYMQLLAVASLGMKGDLTGSVNGPLWSLNYEIQLYIFSGIIAFMIAGTRSWGLRIVISLLTLVYLRELSVSRHGVQFSLQYVAYAAFAFGYSVNLFRSHWTNRKLWLACITLIACLIFLAYRVKDKNILMDMDSAWLAAQIPFAGLIALWIGWLSKCHIPERYAKLGQFSYTLYIIHFPILLAVFFVLHHVAPASLNAYPWQIVALAAASIIILSARLAKILEQAANQRRFVSAMMTRQLAKKKPT